MEQLMQNWFSGPLGSALVRLLNMSAAAAVLICVVILLRALLRRAPKWTRGILWAIVAVQLVCPISLRSPLSVYRFLPRADDVKSDQVEVFRAGGGSEKPLLVLEAPQIAGYEPAVENGRPSAALSEAAPQPRPAPSVYLPAAGSIWLAGIAVMLLYALLSWLTLRRKVRLSVPLSGRTMLCDAIDTPFILGVARPRVYLPSGLSDAQRAAVTAHERAHLRRGDHLWKLLGWLLLSVHWFNPLVWLAYALLCRDIELACDEKAVREMDLSARADYSQALLDCAAPRALLRVCPLAFGEVGIKARIKAVLNYRKPVFWVVVLAVVICIVVAVCFLTRPGPIQVPEPSPSSAATTPEPTMKLSPPMYEEFDAATARVYFLDEAYYTDARDPFRSFSITLDMDKELFQFYETPISSYIGLGRFEREGDILTIRDSDSGHARVNRFRMTDDGETLVWIEDGSDNFTFVKLTDGASFSLDHTPAVPVPTLRSGVYAGPGFSIRINTENGSFIYNESPISSHISIGLYGLDGDILTLSDPWPTGDGKSAVRVNRFRVEPDRLVWLAEGSDNFVFVTLTDGASFIRKETAASPRQMTMEDVRALAAKGDALTWDDLLCFEGTDYGSGMYIYRFPIDANYCLEASDGKLTGAPSSVKLVAADRDGTFRAAPGLYIDIRREDVDAFLSRPPGPYLTVTSAGQSAAAVPHMLHARTWSDELHLWIAADGVPIQELLERPDQIPTLTLADDFALSFGGGAVRKSPLIVYDDQLYQRNGSDPGDAALNWLAPGTWYCGVEVHGPLGRYIAGEDAYEESVYVCVFRLIVPEGERPAPYAPAEAHDLVKAELPIAGDVHTVTDAAALAQLELWLFNATELPSAGCPFSTVLTLTRADGSTFSLCPADDSCGVVFADGKYYRYAAGNDAFWRLFGIELRHEL